MHIQNLNEYNEYNKLIGIKKLPRIVIIIDEASDLMCDANARETLESTLNSFSRLARAVGVHMIFVTQNPVKSVITNEVYNNLATKFAFAVSDFTQSLVIMKMKGAESLLGQGDMYIKKMQDVMRAQCAYISLSEIKAVVDYILENNSYMINSIVYKPIKWLSLKNIVDTGSINVFDLIHINKDNIKLMTKTMNKLVDDGYLSLNTTGNNPQWNILISKEDFYAEWEKRFGKHDPDGTDDTDGE